MSRQLRNKYMGDDYEAEDVEDNDIENENEVLDSDTENNDDERMSFLLNTSSRSNVSNRSNRSGAGTNNSNSSSNSSSNGRSIVGMITSTMNSNSPYRSKRCGLLLVALCFVLILVIGRFALTTPTIKSITGGSDSWNKTKTNDVTNKTDNSKSRSKNKAKQQSTSAPKIEPPILGKPKLNDDLLPGYKKAFSEVSNAYIKRGKTTLTTEQINDITMKWGYWDKVHPPRYLQSSLLSQQQQLAETSELYSLYSTYKHQDIPRSEFPVGSWQTNASYLSEFLPFAMQYVENCMEGILAEYGHSKYDPNPENKTLWERAFMFNISLLSNNERYDLKHPIGNAGYAKTSTMQRIQKHLLHSIMTENTFTVVMGGHSAAAGHGNHFQQSYTLQVQRVLEPILSRLGITHKSHNFGMGGLGTIQNALGMANLYGTNIDVLIWDSSMTEGDGPSKDIYARIGLLSGQNKVPILWGRPDDGRYDNIVSGCGSILTGFWGMSMAGIPNTESAIQVKKLPYAAQYLQCTNEANDLCKNSRYQSQCWITRNDTVQPKTKQKSQPGGQAKWHPGNRVHQLQGRAIAFQILHQLYNAIHFWYNTPNYDVPDSAWHLTDDFERIQKAVKNTKNTPCYDFQLPDKVCDIPLQSRSEFTPRYNPAMTSIRSIIKQGVWIPQPPKNMYDPPEPHIDIFDAPYPHVDILSIIENGIDYVPNRIRTEILQGYHEPIRDLRETEEVNQAEQQSHPTQTLDNNSPKRVPITSGLKPGQGWYIKTKSAPDNCDGSYDSFCGRSWDNDCMLNGHNDMRGGLGFDSYSGWLILNLENVIHDIIMIRVEDWWGPNNNPRTDNWTCENNNKNCTNPSLRQLGYSNYATSSTSSSSSFISQSKPREHRNIGENPNKCDTFVFEFAIDGIITKWDKKAWDANRRQIQRVVPIWVLSNGSSRTSSANDTNSKSLIGRDVELAMRLTGCGRLTTFGLSHVYWA